MLLHWAALGGHDRLVRYLLENGQPEDSLDDVIFRLYYMYIIYKYILNCCHFIQMQTTPLILAASGGRNDVVKTLIEYGVNINAKNQEGHSALQYAASKGWTEVRLKKFSK